MKKIVIINGHPNKESFNSALVHAYEEGALAQQAEIRVIPIGELQFDPNLQYGYQQRMELEPDLIQAWDSILWADHLVWVHPVWWGGLPAVTKGFVDRLFLPGMAYKYRPNSVWWDKLLSGKTAHIIITLDQPGWYYRLFFGRPSVNQLKKSILEFCGIKPVKVTYVGVIRNSTDAQRTKWLDKIKSLGRQLL
ncbi:Putative NADPH-quinone reductase (modulator of drug activity B) [Sphingobacterium nematocida]|uniref:Putative NADPH-quinone reductase (Modulator of drug activity B) n=1 Tax=Sphingobacterium nematocida TaxID=1513896 RepID=A0A1T5GA36_9SPHI|nr:NAD(P)H-dependent oxidoreductase [Sphingobacterium nematocida]SKC05259.1 Putative NADPH-quinone reductase (modulator of drug activity B) [Sphingobacterium nematocida]